MGDRLYIKMDGLVNRSCDKITVIGAVVLGVVSYLQGEGHKVMYLQGEGHKVMYLQGEGHNACHSSNNGF